MTAQDMYVYKRSWLAFSNLAPDRRVAPTKNAVRIESS